MVFRDGLESVAPTRSRNFPGYRERGLGLVRGLCLERSLLYWSDPSEDTDPNTALCPACRKNEPFGAGWYRPAVRVTTGVMAASADARDSSPQRIES